MKYSSEKAELLAQWKAELLREMQSFGIECDPALALKEVQKVYEKNIYAAKSAYFNEQYGWKKLQVEITDLDKVLADPEIHVRSFDRETGEVVVRYWTDSDAAAITKIKKEIENVKKKMG